MPGRVLQLAEHGRILLYFSSILLDETRYSLLSTRLRTSYGHGEESVEAWCASLMRIGTMVAEPLPEIGQVCRDPNDDHVIAAAVAADAAAIVTGDKDLLALGRYRTIRIVTARIFLDEIMEEE